MKTTNNNEQKIYCITVGALLSYLPLTDFLNNFFNVVLRFGTSLDTLLCYVVLWMLVLWPMYYIHKNIKRDISVIFIVLLVAWFLSYGYLAGAEKPELFFTSWIDIHGNPFYIFFAYAFFGYVATRYITDYDLLQRVLVRFSVVVVVCSTMSFFLTLSSKFQAQYMVFSYNMTMQSVFLFLYYFEKRNPLHLVVGILGISMILMAGCRGAIVCVLGCVLLYAFFGRMKMSKKILLVFVLAIAAVLVFINFYAILDYLIELAEEMKMSSRTLRLIQDGEFFEDSGRGKIQEQIIEKFDVVGYGLYGDRIITKENTYAHHLFLEIICHYGYMLGIFLILVIMNTVFKGLFTKNSKIRFLVIVMLSTGLFKLFFSGSYLNQEPAFYVLLGLCVNAIVERRKR